MRAALAAKQAWRPLIQRHAPERAATKIAAAFEAEGVELTTDANRTGAVLVYARRLR